MWQIFIKCVSSTYPDYIYHKIFLFLKSISITLIRNQKVFYLFYQWFLDEIYIVWIYSEVSNKHGVFLILFENIFPTTCLIRVSTLINFWETCHKYCFLCNKYEKKSQLHALLEPPRLFDFGNFSYLHVNRTLHAY